MPTITHHNFFPVQGRERKEGGRGDEERRREVDEEMEERG
jgi:hypothetical protein